jgi:hypothetical protein
VTTISITVDEELAQRISEIAAERGAVPEGLVTDYLQYLAAGGDPVIEGDDLPIEGMLKLVEVGGSFDWLKDEPDLYADVELEPYD